MSALLHQPVSTLDMIVQGLTRDTERLVVTGAAGEQVTAQGLADEITRYQQVLEALEPRPKRAAILSRNRIEVLYASNALGFASIVSTALHPIGALDDYVYVIEDAEIDTLLFDPTYYSDTATTLQQRAPGLKHLLALGKTEVGIDLAEHAAAMAPRTLIAPAADPDALFRIAYSGGTTGKPKGIMTTNRMAATSALIQLTSWEWPEEIRHLICAPLSHSGAAVLSAILTKGGSLVVLPGFDPVSTMEAIERHRITSVLMVPTMILAMIDHPRFGEFDLSSLEVVFYGASAFPAARLRDAISKMGKVFFQFYGQSEAPMSVTLMRRDEHDPEDLLRLASCGRPSPLVRVELLDDDCNPVADGMPGEICVRGPLVMGGYLNKPEETAKAFEGDWLHTGDVAIKGPDGFLRIVDRKKDMIVTGGFNVFAREVEDVLTEYPGVRQAAVIGVPDEKWGEAVKGVVVLEPGVTVSAEALITSVREKKGAVQAPKTIDFVDALPLSPVGKPDKKALRARYAPV